MSAYISFYLKHKDSAYLPLSHWSRSSAVFQAFDNEIPYEGCVEVNDAFLDRARAELKERLDRFESMRQDSLKTIEFLKTLEAPLDEKMERYQEEQQYLADTDDDIKETRAAMLYITFLREILESNDEYSDIHAQLYATYECDPNYEENSEN